MNLLTNVFNSDDILIKKINKEYIIITIIMIIIMGLLLIIKKDNYYESSYSVVDNNIILVVDSKYVNNVEKSKEIIINEIKIQYSIETIEEVSNYYLVNVKTKNKIKNNNYGTYKIYLGKERLFDYIIRVIKN